MPLFPPVGETEYPEHNVLGHSWDPGDQCLDSNPTLVSTAGASSPLRSIQVIDDSVSSICIDDDDAFEIGDAIQVVRETQNTQDLSEFDKYNLKVARELISRETSTHKGYSTSSHTSLWQAGRVDGGVNNGFFTPAHKETQLVEGNLDTGTVYTIDVDRESLLSRPLALARRFKLGQGFSNMDFNSLLLSGAVGLPHISDMYVCLYVSGPLGMTLGYFIGAILSLFVLLPQLEMSAFAPLQGGFTACVGKYVNRSLGYATGLLYFSWCGISFAINLVATVATLVVYPALNVTDASSLVWFTFALVLVFLMNILPPRLLATGARIFSWVAFLMLMSILCFNWCMNAGMVAPLHLHTGLRFWIASSSTPSQKAGLFKSYFAKSNIGGATGRFFQIWFAVAISLRTYSEADKVMTVIPEVRNPRKALPRAVKTLCARFFLFHVMGAFTLALNVSAWDTLYAQARSDDVTVGYCTISSIRWLHFHDSLTVIPWHMSFVRNQVCLAIYIVNSLMAFCGLFSTAVELYATSRTLYGLAVDRYIGKVFRATSRDSLPYLAIFASTTCGFLVYTVSSDNGAVLFWVLSQFAIGLTLVTWASVTFAYIRYTKALAIAHGVSRNDDDYPYRAPFQPYGAWFALTACVILAIGSLYDFSNLNAPWTSRVILSVYAPAILFVAVFFLHFARHRTGLIPLVDIEFSDCRAQLDTQDWEEDRVYHKEFRGSLLKFYRRAAKGAVGVTRYVLALVERTKKGCNLTSK